MGRPARYQLSPSEAVRKATEQAHREKVAAKKRIHSYDRATVVPGSAGEAASASEAKTQTSPTRQSIPASLAGRMFSRIT